MEVRTLEGDLADPASAAWSGADSATISLAPVPLDAQPTEYIRTKWADVSYGNVSEVTVAAAHDGSQAWVRLEWADSSEPNTEFPDSAAVYFPADGDAPAATIGADGSPVNLWFWRDGAAEGRDLTATGPGRFRPRADGAVGVAAALEGGRWSVVLSHSIGDLREAGRLGVAVWDGSNEERAGIGAATPEWVSLTIES